MSVENNIITTVQEVYFDLVDLGESNNLKRIRLKGFQEFNNMQNFIDEQIMKISYLESHLKTLLNIKDED